MDLTKELFDFLRSENKTLHIKEDNKFYVLVKIPHSSEIDLLFMNRNNYHKTTFDDELKYCGFYNKEKDELYDINYTLKSDFLKLDYSDETYKSISNLLNEFNIKVRETVTQYVEDYKEEFYEAAKGYESNITERDVYQYVIDNQKEVKYECGYSSSDNQNVLLYFDEGEQHVYDVSLGFIEINKDYIGKQLIDIDKKNELLNSIHNNPDHEIYKRKEIADIMKNGEYVNVHLFINKNGIDYDFKYDAAVLKNYWDYSYLSTYYMQAPDRKEFEKLYGTNEDFHYEDIYKIEYRNKVVYEDNDFIKQEPNSSVDEELTV